MSSYDTGRQAEQAAATYLEMRGYKVLERNWRRPRCEIDVIALKDDVIYFVEVKYRANDDQGSGFDAITTSKLKKMQYAADYWVEESKWRGEYSLAAIELAGRDFTVLSFIDSVLV